MFVGSMSLDCFGRFLDQKITTEKKGTVIWPSVAMPDCFGGIVAIFFSGFLNQITNYDQKKKVQLSEMARRLYLFFGCNLIDKGGSPWKNIAHNFHFSKYEIW
jgi:hypothetical protein